MEEQEKTKKTTSKQTTKTSSKKANNTKDTSKKKETKKVESQKKDKKENKQIDSKKKNTKNEAKSVAAKKIEKKKTTKADKESNEKATKNKLVESQKINNNNEVMKLIKIILIIIVIFGAFYVLTLVINKLSSDKTSENDNELLPVTIQYEEILIGSLLNQSNNEYYTFIYSPEEYTSDECLYLLDQISSKEKAKVYKIDYTNGFNEKYVAEESNIKVADMKDFKIKGITLIQVQNKRVMNYWEGKEAVISQLKSLAK